MVRRYCLLPRNMLDYHTLRGGYVIDMDGDGLENATGCRHGEKPCRNREYSRYVYGYHGVPF